MTRAALMILLLTLSLGAQVASKPSAPTEESTIQRFRAHARPRTPALQPPLSAEEKNTIRRFREAKPSVVYISAYLERKNLETGELTRTPAGTGTGFVWDEWGHIVTNHHIISIEQGGKLFGDAETVEVTLANGKTYRGRVIGTSFAYDIAVIQAFAPLEDMRPIPIGLSGSLQVGQSVLAIGNPFGLDHSLSRGVISALGREIATGYNTWILNSIQTDAAINPGNSGGPLLDSGGRLIGMNSAIVSTKGEGSVGVGFAIPVDTLNEIVPRLIARGSLAPPRMGFTVMPSAQAFSVFGIPRGLVVTEVTPGTPAARAGLKAVEWDNAGRPRAMGDILLGYQGRVIESEGQFMAMLEVEPPKDEVVFDVLRNGQIIKVKLNLKDAKPQPDRL